MLQRDTSQRNRPRAAHRLRHVAATHPPATHSPTTTPTLLQDPNPTGGLLRGTTTRAMTGGLVTFTDLYINEAGSPYIIAFEFT